MSRLRPPSAGAAARRYAIVVPALDRTGPVNVACDIGRGAAARGWRVLLLTLSARVERDDLDFADEVRPFTVADLWRLHGVVHTHCLRPDLLGGLLSLNRRCMLVTTVHNFFLFDVGFDHRRPYVIAAWHLWRLALSRYRAVVCISDAMRRYYHRRMPECALAIAPNFRDFRSPPLPVPELTSAWLRSQRAADRRLLAYVGSLSPRKNLSGLLQALAPHDACALLLCGTGVEAEALCSLADDLGLSHRVHFAGQLPDPRAAIAACDMLVLPSFAEGFPLVVLEAASVGVPALLSNIAVHRELAAIGFGTTFDHRRGTDLLQRISETLGAHPAPDPALQRLWRDHYSTGPGFDRYEALIAAVRRPP